MSSIKKTFTDTRLREMGTYRDVESVAEELNAIHDRKVDLDDRASLERRIADLARLEQLDLTAAHHAFRLEIVKEGEGFLPLLSRLSLLAGFDPARIARQDEAHDSDVAALNRKKRRPYMYNTAVRGIQLGLRDFAERAHPLRDSRSIERVLLDTQKKVDGSTPGPIGMIGHGNYFVGHAASSDIFSPQEPRLRKRGDKTTIVYEIPTKLHGITDIELRVPRDELSFDPAKHGDLFSEEDGELTAHPTLNAVINALSAHPNYAQEFGPDFGDREIYIASRDFDLALNPPPPRRRPRDKPHRLLR